MYEYVENPVTWREIAVGTLMTRIRGQCVKQINH